MVGVNKKNRVCKDGSRQSSDGNNPSSRSFFKIMIGSFREVLFIPPKFAETLVRLVNQNVYLEDSNGKSSKVKVARVDGSLAFQEGWHGFVVDHCIDTGEVLIFNYISRSLFRVQVFGTNACERVSFLEGNSTHLYEENITKADFSFENLLLPRRRKSFEAELEGDLSIPSSKMREGDCVDNCMKNDNGSSKTVDAMDISGSLISTIGGQATEKPEEKGNSLVEEPKAAVVNKTSLPNLKTVKSEPHADHEASLCIEEKLAGHKHTHGESPTSSAVPYDPKLNFLLSLNTAEKGIEGAGEQEKHNIQTLEAMGTKLIAPEEVVCKFPAAEEGVCDLVNNDLENEFSVCRITPVAVDSSELAPCISCTNNVTRAQDTSCRSACFPEVTYLIPKVDFVEGETSHCKHAYEENRNSPGSVSRKDLSPLVGNEGSVQDLPALDTTKGNTCQSGMVHDPCQEEDEMDNIVQQCQDLKVVKVEVMDVDDPFLQDSLCLSVTLSSNLISWLELPQRLPYRKGKIKKDSKLVVLQDPSHRLWPVMYNESINFIGFLSGWKDFAIANNLQQGNQCEFFDVGGDDVFQVKITQSQNLLSEL